MRSAGAEFLIILLSKKSDGIWIRSRTSIVHCAGGSRTATAFGTARLRAWRRLLQPVEYLLDRRLLPPLRPLLDKDAVPFMQAGVTVRGLAYNYPPDGDRAREDKWELETTL